LSLPDPYERYLVEPLFRPFAEAVLTRLHLTPDDSLLDVACGTGIVARCARRTLGPQARIVGVDAAPAMLSVARHADSTIEWREGNAMKLPVQTDERFSLVVCHQGLQFFPDKLAVPYGRCTAQDGTLNVRVNNAWTPSLSPDGPVTTLMPRLRQIQRGTSKPPAFRTPALTNLVRSSICESRSNSST
jgi:SAM-dependent methyltransferase